MGGLDEYAVPGTSSSVPKTLLAFSGSSYAELDVGVGPANGAIGVAWHKNGNIDPLSINRGFDSVRLGVGGGIGAFFGKQGQVVLTITPNSVINAFRGDFVTIPSGP